MLETEIIQNILGQFDRSSKQLNSPFSCDSEIIKIGNDNWAVTMDEFSQDEDFFAATNPADIGSNVAVATLSDLYACGAEPVFYLHSVCVSSETNEHFITEFASGTSHMLREAGCHLIGGDIGQAGQFRCTATALGKISGNRHISRQMPLKPLNIWVTGTLGDANFAAFTGQKSPLFELRKAEAAWIACHARTCMDSSGGLADTLATLAMLNSEMRIELDIEKVPLASHALEFCIQNSIPPLALILGGAGEYELVFCTDENTAPNIEATLIGSARPSDHTGLYFESNGGSVSIENILPDPRDFENIEEYAKSIILLATQLSENNM